MAHSGFLSHYKLVKTDEFSSVFSFKRRFFGSFLSLYIKPNKKVYARLGIVVGKKTAVRAVSRNYMRRVVREWFRLYWPQMVGHDIVIHINRSFWRTDFDKIQAELSQLLQNMKAFLEHTQSKS